MRVRDREQSLQLADFARKDNPGTVGYEGMCQKGVRQQPLPSSKGTPTCHFQMNGFVRLQTPPLNCVWIYLGFSIMIRCWVWERKQQRTCE